MSQGREGPRTDIALRLHIEACSGLVCGSDLDYRIGTVVAGLARKGHRAFCSKPIDISKDSPHDVQESALEGGTSR